MYLKKFLKRLLASALFLNLGPAVGLAADVSMVADNQSWLNANVWPGNSVPSPSNDYFTAVVGDGLLRTSPAGGTGGGNADFPGNSLTVVVGTRLLIKQTTGETASIAGGSGNLVVDGGRVSFAPNSSGSTATFDVNEFRVNATAGALLDVAAWTELATIEGTLTGPGNLLINYENGSSSTGRTVSFDAVDPVGFTGTLTVDEGLILDFGSDAALAGAVELSGSSILHIDQTLTFQEGKLVDPANGAVAAGSYTGASLVALGANYADGGGTLVVEDAMADSDGDGLPDLYEYRIIDADPDDAVADLSDVAGPADSPVTTDFDGDGSGDAEEYAQGTGTIQTPVRSRRASP